MFVMVRTDSAVVWT